MTQRELEKQISEQTGESIQTILQLGFSPLRANTPIEERQEPLVVDWDLLESTRHFERRYS